MREVRMQSNNNTQDSDDDNKAIDKHLTRLPQDVKIVPVQFEQMFDDESQVLEMMEVKKQVGAHASRREKMNSKWVRVVLS